MWHGSMYYEAVCGMALYYEAVCGMALCIMRLCVAWLYVL